MSGRVVVVVMTCVLALFVTSGSTHLAAQTTRARLATAFVEIDRVFRDFATQSHVPGAAWGIVVDGELAHVGVTGFRDLHIEESASIATRFSESPR